MNVILTHPVLSQKYVELYNLAILQIFSSTTMNEIFVMNDTINLTKDNKMLFKVTSLQEYKTTAVQRSSIELKTKTIEDEYNAMAQKRDNFLDFMRQNFTEIDESTLRGVITKNVEEFIRLMEVKPKFPITGEITIEVTLHDIIDKLASTSFESEHCKSEKLFMAILLAILMLHYPTPRNKYKLVFKFAKSLFGKSRLQKSSITCSGNKTITESMDPVAENIFKLNISKLLQITPKAAAETEVVENPLKSLTLQSSKTPPPPPLSPLVGENVGSTNDDSSSRVSDKEQRAADYKLMEENIGREREYYIKSEPLKQYIYSKEALDEIPTNVSPTNVAYTRYEEKKKDLTDTIAGLSSKFNIQSLEDAKKKLAELKAAVKAKTSDVEPPPPPPLAEAKAAEVEATSEANASDVVASDVVEPTAEELQPTPLTGDELFETMMKSEDPSSEEKDTYQKIVLQKFKEGNYQVKSIANWDYKSVSEELKKSEGFRSEVLDLLSITPNGNVYKKLSYLVFIFGNSNCKDPDCTKIYSLTAGSIPFFGTQGGGSKSRRRHRRKPVRKTRRGHTRKSKSKSKSKPKTHRRRRHSRVRKHKKYTSRTR